MRLTDGLQILNLVVISALIPASRWLIRRTEREKYALNQRLCTLERSNSKLETQIDRLIRWVQWMSDNQNIPF